MSHGQIIYALSSGAGKAGVAVIRLSGAGAISIAEKMAHKKLKTRYATLVTLRHPVHGTTLDRALVVVFPAPHSFTGEDVAEFHIHGGRAVLKAVFEALASSGCRMAEAGEFTRRAFANDKLDLTQVEGLSDLIDAETEKQRAQALAQMGGAMSRLYEGWREKLLRSMAHIEADIDFPDEDLPPQIATQRLNELQDFITALDTHLADARRGERLREGFRIAIVGAPNAGKSSLLNMLAQRDAAIVSAQAGTTRDVVEVHLDLAGIPVILADTAGLRQTGDAIESEGMRRALKHAGEADLKLVLFDASAPADQASLDLVDDKTLIVLNKVDLASPTAFALSPFFPLSTLTGQGLPELLAAITRQASQGFDDKSPVLTRPRHRDALMACVQHLRAAKAAYESGKAPELVAEDMRLATRALGRITGRVDTENLLDIIFRDFCLGK